MTSLYLHPATLDFLLMVAYLLILQDQNLTAFNVKKINNELDAIKIWMVANKLTLILSKLNIILVSCYCYGKEQMFSNELNAYTFSDLSIADNVKYLRVTFDKNLTFDSHKHKLEKKLSRSVDILAKVKPFLSNKTLLQLY